MRDVTGHCVEMGGVDGVVVEEEGTAVWGGFSGEDLEEGGFSGAAGADDGEDLSGFGLAIDIGKEVAVAVADGGFGGGEDVEKWGFGVMGLDLVAYCYGFYVASFLFLFLFFLLLHFKLLLLLLFWFSSGRFLSFSVTQINDVFLFLSLSLSLSPLALHVLFK